MRIAVAGATGLIGFRLVTAARAADHEVVEISRRTGVDLVAPDAERLAAALAGAEAVVDVTASASFAESQASPFFTAVATNLGRAATEAGVHRTVLLSIVGIHRSPDFGYYVAKLAHEEATRAAAPGTLVLRSTQFHEFPGQMLRRARDGVAQILDVPIQPVDSAEVVTLLLRLATGEVTHDVDLAGPRVERLVDLARRLVADSGEDVTVVPVPAPASMASGSMLPDDDALVRGPDWQTWLTTSRYPVEAAPART